MNKYNIDNHAGGVKFIWEDIDLLQSAYTNSFYGLLNVVSENFNNAIILSGCDVEESTLTSWDNGWISIDNEVCYVPSGSGSFTIGAKWGIVETDLTVYEKVNESNALTLYPHKQRIGALIDRVGSSDIVYTDSETYIERLFDVATVESIILNGNTFRVTADKIYRLQSNQQHYIKNRPFQVDEGAVVYLESGSDLLIDY